MYIALRELYRLSVRVITCLRIPCARPSLRLIGILGRGPSDRCEVHFLNGTSLLLSSLSNAARNSELA